MMYTSIRHGKDIDGSGQRYRNIFYSSDRPDRKLSGLTAGAKLIVCSHFVETLLRSRPKLETNQLNISRYSCVSMIAST